MVLLKLKKKKPEKKFTRHALKKTRPHLFVNTLPTPEQLEYYDQIIPNGAERFMMMVEKQQAHAHEITKRALTAETWQIRIGQIFGLIIWLTALGLAFLCITKGYEWPGALISVGGISGLITAFLKVRKAGPSRP
jgi:uncharacterized membrane protein